MCLVPAVFLPRLANGQIRFRHIGFAVHHQNHRDLFQPVGIALVPESFVKQSVGDPGPGRIGIGPDGIPQEDIRVVLAGVVRGVGHEERQEGVENVGGPHFADKIRLICIVDGHMHTGGGFHHFPAAVSRAGKPGFHVFIPVLVDAPDFICRHGGQSPGPYHIGTLSLDQFHDRCHGLVIPGPELVHVPGVEEGHLELRPGFQRDQGVRILQGDEPAVFIKRLVVVRTQHLEHVLHL